MPPLPSDLTCCSGGTGFYVEVDMFGHYTLALQLLVPIVPHQSAQHEACGEWAGHCLLHPWLDCSATASYQYQTCTKGEYFFVL